MDSDEKDRMLARYIIECLPSFPFPNDPDRVPLATAIVSSVLQSAPTKVDVDKMLSHVIYCKITPFKDS